MRRWVPLLLVIPLLAPAVARADLLDLGEFGFGAFGVADIPIAQDDAGPGPLLGVRGRMGVLPQLAVEATATLIRDADTSTVAGGDLPAPHVDSFAVSLVTRGAGPGLNLAVSAGLGFTRVRYPGEIGSDAAFSWNLGFGVELPVGPLTLDAGPRLLVINTGGDGSRKHLGLLAGVSYYFD